MPRPSDCTHDLAVDMSLSHGGRQVSFLKKVPNNASCVRQSASVTQESVSRVYREDPLDIMFARKMIVETHMGQTLRDASKIFIENSRASLLSHEGPNAETLSSLPWPFRTIFYNALLPIPPPIDLDQIESAEQSAAASPSVDRQKVDGQ